jgi:hypothetical protein
VTEKSAAVREATLKDEQQTKTRQGVYRETENSGSIIDIA